MPLRAESPTSGAMPLEPDAPDRRKHLRINLSLFWSTFLQLALLLLGSILAWAQTVRMLELEPRAVQTARQIATLVNLSRAALVNADAINRVSLIKTMTEQESLRIVPREPGDVYEPFDSDSLGRRITRELSARLGPDTVVANRVNHVEGLWIGFTIDGDRYWLVTDRGRVSQTAGSTWLVWLVTAAVLSLTGAALIASRLSRPLRHLSLAAKRVRDGNFQPSMLDETLATDEVRSVNIGFNDMTRRLAKIDQDRGIMLAGISHDLRTPLARLRLESELSVADPQARAAMEADIGQLDAIIGKFLEYARPTHVQLSPVSLRSLLESVAFGSRNRNDIQIKLDLTPGLLVEVDEVELGRVFSNLIENAGRYGKSADGIARVEITARANEHWVYVRLRDRGPGVPEIQLIELTKPFYRAEAARTMANGAGLGLAIAERTCQRMGGTFQLANMRSGGLAANLRLRRAPEDAISTLPNIS